MISGNCWWVEYATRPWEICRWKKKLAMHTGLTIVRTLLCREDLHLNIEPVCIVHLGTIKYKSWAMLLPSWTLPRCSMTCWFIRVFWMWFEGTVFELDHVFVLYIILLLDFLCHSLVSRVIGAGYSTYTSEQHQREFWPTLHLNSIRLKSSRVNFFDSMDPILSKVSNKYHSS